MLNKFRTVKLLLAMILCLGLAQSVYGAACTVAYVWPVAGVTAPTKTQSATRNTVVADVTCLFDSTAVAITHNLQIANATGANGIPKVTITTLSAGTVASVPFIAFTDANTLTVDKNTTAANTAITFRVWIERPFAPTR